MHTLLLADDSITIQRVIAMTFANESFHVVAVSDGQQAIDRMASVRPDIVLAGTTMPNVTGYDVARFVRSQPAWAHVPVLLLTGAFESVDDARLKASGASGILEKPFEPTTVISRVKELLGIKGGTPAAPASGRLVTSADGPARKAGKPAGAPVPSVAPVSSRTREAAPARSAATSWETLREESGLAPGAPSVEGGGAAGAADYLDTLDAAFDSLDQHLAGRRLDGSAGRNPDAPARRPGPPDPRSPGRLPGNQGDVDPRPSLVAAAQGPNPVFEVESDWFATGDQSDADRLAEQRRLAAEMGIHEVDVVPRAESGGLAADLDFGVDLGAPRTPGAERRAAVEEVAETAPPEWAPAAPVAPVAPSVPASGVADAFSALLAFEQGEQHEMPAVAEPPPLAAPEITSEMLDDLAARVAERLGESLLGEQLRDEVTRAVRDAVRTAVSDTSERLVRDEIGRIRQQAERE